MENGKLQIDFNIQGKTLRATLEDNDTAQELYRRLPLEITMEELHGNEKYYYFDEVFPSHPKCVGMIEKGDLMLYGDDCLVLFYQSFSTSYAYTKIGTVNQADLLDDVLDRTSISVVITKV